MKHSLIVVAVAAVLLLAGCASSPKEATPSMGLPAYSTASGSLYTPQHTMADISWKTSPILPVEYDIDMYAGAPAEVQAQIAVIDDLISRGQFQTAWTTPCDGAYGLAKRTELAHQYFAYSMMHQMFAFKNLEPGETLYDVRTNYTGDLNMVMWDPVEVINGYIAENGDSAILHMALAYYYSDTRLRYGDDWILTRKELAQAAIDEYQKATDMGLKLDAYHTSVWGENYMELGNFDQAIPLFKKSLAMDDDVDVHYNLATSYYQAEHWEPYLDEAIAEMVYSAQMYDYIPYKLDALCVLLDMAYQADEYELGDAAADVVLVLGTEDVSALFSVMDWYLHRENVDAVIEAASTLFALYPGNLDLLDDVAKRFANGGQFEQYNRFLEQNIARYSDDDEVLADLHYFYGVYWHNFDEYEKSIDEIKLARFYFTKAGLYEGDLKQALEDIING